MGILLSDFAYGNADLKKAIYVI